MLYIKYNNRVIYGFYKIDVRFFTENRELEETIRFKNQDINIIVKIRFFLFPNRRILI